MSPCNNAQMNDDPTVSADVTVTRLGPFAVLSPNTHFADVWFQENLADLRPGNAVGVAVEYRDLDAVLASALEAGLVVD